MKTMFSSCQDVGLLRSMLDDCGEEPEMAAEQRGSLIVWCYERINEKSCTVPI
jgi:hypothetical protein